MKSPLPAVCRRAIGLCSLAIAVVAFGAARASAQARFAGKANQGMHVYATFEGSGSSSGLIFDMNNMVGYDFNPTLGFDVGVPCYFSRRRRSRALPRPLLEWAIFIWTGA